MAASGAKICGLSTAETVQAALDRDAAYIGFVIFAASPRHVSAQTAARLAEPARARAKIVAVVVDPDDALLDDIAMRLRPDLIQFHGRETPARVREAAARARAGAIKALSISEAGDLQTAQPFESVVDHLMFDARPPPGSSRPGGVGARFDWTWLADQRFERPYFLAGGLDPWNVGEAIAQSHAPLVDVSSGVERGPGIKDPALIAAFLDAVRRA